MHPLQKYNFCNVILGTLKDGHCLTGLDHSRLTGTRYATQLIKIHFFLQHDKI